MGFEDTIKRAVDILYDNFKQVADKPQLTRQLKKNMAKAKRRSDRVWRAKMWVRLIERRQSRLFEEQKRRNGWDKDPVFIQANRAAVMMAFSKFDEAELFPNSMYVHYKKIIAEDKAAKQHLKFLEFTRMQEIKDRLAYGDMEDFKYNENV